MSTGESSLLNAAPQTGRDARAGRPFHAAMSATSLAEIEHDLIPVTLKFFKEERGFGFVIASDGIDLFAHASCFRIVEKGGRLRAPRKNELTENSLGKNPSLFCVRGPGKDGKDAAVVWLVKTA